MSLMIDVSAFELDAEEQELLQHPFVSSVILFARNFHDKQQIYALTKAIRQAAKRPILIAVDQEGGRVQRFIKGYNKIPAMADAAFFAKTHAKKYPQHNILQELGWLMATEVIASGVDLSFAPVLDLNGVSDVIGKRAFADNPTDVETNAKQFIFGMQQAGMAACGKHFPGHGSVQADTHHAAAVDNRSKEEIFNLDILPFKNLIAQNLLQAVMPAHVIYSNVDDKPAGFSKHWLQTILRKQLGFNGVIFSDDLSMQAANVAGNYVDKAHAAYDAGCTVALACNNREGAVSILDAWQQFKSKQTQAEEKKQQAVLELTVNKPHTFNELEQTQRWRDASKICHQIADVVN
ncbi:glycoside hydrolase family 3 [Catenovulum agarivorans DS-2]|uniref:Beta-hexosaminidase n=1 Tax=Catenovulum agarivorans DS-2 TaxID=1328313 RepID=W7QHH2_9ALTE|nr:beta-N-acetylhexosaminidase [Catenovulum agarivorans]EWH11331.1 glycoside hydrolase family 3 [Catenovulum agarivorans DS-2]